MLRHQPPLSLRIAVRPGGVAALRHGALPRTVMQPENTGAKGHVVYYSRCFGAETIRVARSHPAWSVSSAAADQLDDVTRLKAVHPAGSAGNALWPGPRSGTDET